MDTQIDYVQVFKALADETRLQIVEMLSCGEMCACDILEYFHCTQPTLSYHLKILTDCGLVTGRKEGSWIRYSINNAIASSIKDYWSQITTAKEACICNKINKKGNCE